MAAICRRGIVEEILSVTIAIIFAVRAEMHVSLYFPKGFSGWDSKPESPVSSPRKQGRLSGNRNLRLARRDTDKHNHSVRTDVLALAFLNLLRWKQLKHSPFLSLNSDLTVPDLVSVLICAPHALQALGLQTRDS